MIYVVAEVVLIMAALFFSVCSLGTELKSGDRCVTLTGVFLLAFCAVMLIQMVYGGA